MRQALLLALLGLAPSITRAVDWVPANQSSRGRHQATFTALPDGRVLLVGGVDDFGSPLATTELYDPIENTWNAAGSMTRARYLHTATLLADGRVLVVGGTDGIGPLSSVDIFDPKTGIWAPGPSMSAARYRHTATLRPAAGNTVLVVGGFSGGPSSSVEEFSPTTNLWTLRNSLTQARYDHAAVLLRDQSTVLVTGGFDNNNPAAPRTSAERYNGSGWTSSTMANAHAVHSATLLATGQVVVAGGIQDNAGTTSKKTEFYTFGSNSWAAGSDLAAPRARHAAILMPDGNLALIGGFGANFTETFTPVGAATAVTDAALSTIGVLDNCVLECATQSPDSTGFGQSGPCAIGQNDGSPCVVSGAPNVCKSSAPTDTAVVCEDTQYIHNLSLTGTTNRKFTLTLSADESQALGNRLSGTILTDAITVTGGEIVLADDSVLTLSAGFAVLPVRTDSFEGGLNVALEMQGVTVSGFTPSSDFCTIADSECPEELVLAGEASITAGTAQIDQMIFSDTLRYNGSWDFLPIKQCSFPPCSNTVLPTPVFNHNAAVLPTGQVVTVGGIEPFGQTVTQAQSLVSDIGTWSAGAAPTGRQLHAATLLTSGEVLVTGGDTGSTPPSAPTSNARLLSATGGSVSAAGSLGSSRESHSATLLPDGRVLACGGYTGADWTSGVVHSTSTCELYTRGGNSWSYTVSLTTPRAHHTATLLFTGQVLITGGVDQNGTPLSYSEIFDMFLSTSFRVAPLNIARYEHTATLLQDGRVLVAGGRQINPLGISELFDPSALTWTTAQMAANRYRHAATFLLDGRVVATGGLDIFGFPLKSTEIFDPESNSWSSSVDMNVQHAGHTGTLLPNGKVVIAGGATGFDQTSSTTTVETFENNVWRAELLVGTDHPMGTRRAKHTATLLNNGSVLMVGGWNGSAVTDSSELAYMTDLSPHASLQPSIASLSVTTGTPPGTTIVVSGNQLSGGSQSSGGMNFSDSSADRPRLFLRPHDSGNAGTASGSSYIINASSTIYSSASPMSITDPDTGGNDSFSFTTPQTGCGNYQVLVAAGGKLSTASTFKIQPLSVASSPTVTGVGLSPSQVRFNFPVTHASNYIVYPATEPGTIVLWTSSTTATYQNLSTNTPVGIVARAENCISTSTLSLPVTVYSLAAVPSTPTVVSVSSFGASISWGANGNPGGTQYTIAYSSQGFGSQGSECVLPSRCSSTVSNSLSIAGLDASTTWLFQVRAENGDGVTTSFSPQAGALTLPDRPTNVLGAALGISSISWTWDALPWATSYKVYAATAAPPTLLGSATQALFIQTGLSPNSTASLRVSGVQGASEGQLSVSTATAHSLAIAPTPSLNGSTSLTADLVWETNGNPAGTPYELSYSTDNFLLNQTFFIQFSNNVTGTSTTVTGLQANTTYYFRMRAQNFSGFASAYSSVVSTKTNIEVPLNLAGTTLGVSSVSWTWTAVPYAETYDVFLATNTATSLGTTISTNPVLFVHSGLGVNKPSQIVSRARNLAGTLIGPLSPASAVVYSAANAPGQPQVVSITSKTITVSFSDSGNPANTTYILEAATNTLFNQGRVPDLSTTNVTGVRLTGFLQKTTYYIRAYAVNGSNTVTAFSATTNTVTSAGGIIEANVPRSQEKTLSATLNSNRVATLTIPKGSFTDGVLLTVQDSTRTPCGPIPASVEIDVSPDQQPTEPLSFSLTYHLTDVAGMDQTRLVLTRYDELTGNCVPLRSVVTVTGSTRTVSAKLDHLSLYQISLSTPSSTLATAEAYPNPLRPSVAGQSFMTFKSLPAGADVQVYTPRGELVWDTVTDPSGVAQWPGTNKSGRRVASGVYIVLLKQGDTTRTMKVAVER